MSDPTSTIAVTQGATMSPNVVTTSGAGKAYQQVALSTAIAVQDATDYLRYVQTVSSTALGVGMAQLLATGDSKYVDAIEIANKMAVDAASNYRTIGTNAADVLKGFPPGPGVFPEAGGGEESG